MSPLRLAVFRKDDARGCRGVMRPRGPGDIRGVVRSMSVLRSHDWVVRNNRARPHASLGQPFTEGIGLQSDAREDVLP